MQDVTVGVFQGHQRKVGARVAVQCSCCAQGADDARSFIGVLTPTDEYRRVGAVAVQGLHRAALAAGGAEAVSGYLVHFGGDALW
ncbi:hypothetical protein D3C72_2239500 [compost metagenome]